jgi:hypothetical protein
MDIKAVALFVVALVVISSATGASVCKRRGIVGTKGILKIASLTFLALFAGVAALFYILATYFPH